MDFIISLIQQYGAFYAYVIVFLGSLIEGEAIILSASALAYMGHLNIYKIMCIAFCGTWFADQALYMIGRAKGKVIFEYFPKLQKPAQKGFELLRKWDAGFIIACRFIYGIRITSCMVVGAAGIEPRRFIPLNILSAIIWTLVSCTAGYLLGPIVVAFFENFHRLQKYILLFFSILLIVWILWKKFHKKHQS